MRRTFALLVIAVSISLAPSWLTPVAHLPGPSPVAVREARAQSEPYYQGKQIRIIVGFSPGGFYDRWARLLARYMPKYIPGNPDMIVQNMPGASSVIAANYVYSVAKPDGLTVGMPINSLYLEQLVDRKEARFDVRKFNWIGTQETAPQIIYVRADAPYKTIEDVISAKEPPKCGATGTGSTGFIFPRVLEETIGAKFNMVLGYPGGSEIDIAMEKGEVNCRGMDIPPHFGREPFLTWHKKGFDQHLVQGGIQGGKKRDPRAADTPTYLELMEKYRTPEASRRMVQVIMAAGDFGRPMMTTPGVPANRVKMLRLAYQQALEDPELRAEAKKGRMDVDPTPGEELQGMINEIMEQPADVIQRVKKILEN